MEYTSNWSPGRMPRDAAEPPLFWARRRRRCSRKKSVISLQIEATEVSVVGIVSGGALVEDGSVILSLSLFQEITGNQGKINVIDVRVSSLDHRRRGQAAL